MVASLAARIAPKDGAGTVSSGEMGLIAKTLANVGCRIVERMARVIIGLTACLCKVVSSMLFGGTLGVTQEIRAGTLIVL